MSRFHAILPRAVVALVVLSGWPAVALAGVPTAEQAQTALGAIPQEARRNIKGTMKVTQLHDSGAAKEVRGIVRGNEKAMFLDESGRILEEHEIAGPFTWVEIPKPGGGMLDVEAHILKDGKQLRGAAAVAGLQEMLTISIKAELAAKSESKRAAELKGSSVDKYVAEQREVMMMFLSELLTDH